MEKSPNSEALELDKTLHNVETDIASAEASLSAALKDAEHAVQAAMLANNQHADELS